MRWSGDGFDVGNGDVLSEEGEEACDKKEGQEAQREAVMKIDISIAQAQFLLRLVAESKEWNNGASVGDVLIPLETALKEESDKLAQTASQGGRKP